MPIQQSQAVVEAYINRRLRHNQGTFKYRGATAWNGLPSDLRLLNCNSNTFKRALYDDFAILAYEFLRYYMI